MILNFLSRSILFCTITISYELVIIKYQGINSGIPLLRCNWRTKRRRSKNVLLFEASPLRNIFSHRYACVISPSSFSLLNSSFSFLRIVKNVNDLSCSKLPCLQTIRLLNKSSCGTYINVCVCRFAKWIWGVSLTLEFETSFWVTFSCFPLNTR